MRELYFDLWPGDDIKGTATGELTQSYDRKYRKVDNGTDHGSFTINRNDSQWAWLNATTEPLIRVRRVSGGPFDYDDSRYVGAFFAEVAEVTTISPNEQGGEVAKVSGRGLEAILDRAVVNEVATHPDDIGDVYTATVYQDGMWHIDGAVVSNAGTPGSVLRIFLRNAETQTPEPMPELTHDFTVLHDSNGETWDYNTAKWSFPVGQELGEVLGTLIQTGLYYDLTPDVNLSAWKDHQGVDRTATVTIAAGKSDDKGNVSGPAGFSLIRGPAKSRVLVEGARDDDGEKVYRWVDDSALEDDIGVRQGGARYHATPTTALLDAFGEKYLADRATLHSGIPDLPYVETDGNEALIDYDVGDTITLDVPGLPATAMVKAITLVQLANGDADPIIEFEEQAWAGIGSQESKEVVYREECCDDEEPGPFVPPSDGSTVIDVTLTVGSHAHLGLGSPPDHNWDQSADYGAVGVLTSGFQYRLIGAVTYNQENPLNGPDTMVGPFLGLYAGTDGTVSDPPSTLIDAPTFGWEVGGSPSDGLDTGNNSGWVAAGSYATGQVYTSPWKEFTGPDTPVNIALHGQPNSGFYGFHFIVAARLEIRNGDGSPIVGSGPTAPTVGQPVHEQQGAPSGGVYTVNYPYMPGSLIVHVGGLLVPVIETDPTAGEWEFADGFNPGGSTIIVHYQAASGTPTGGTNGQVTPGTPVLPPSISPSALGWFDVTDYGATNDGATDDTSAINDAIDALNAAGGGVLYFPAGEGYVISSALTAIDVPCVVRGDGGGAYPYATGVGSRIEQTSDTASAFTFTDPGWAIEDLAIVNTEGAPTAGAGIVAASLGPLYARMTRIQVAGFYDCLDLSDNQRWTLTDSFILDPVRYGIRIRGGDDGDQAITGCYFMADTHDADAAIRLEGAGGLKIVNTKINMRGTGGQFVDGISVSIGAGVSTVILLVSGSSIENVSRHAIDVATVSTGTFGEITVVGCQVGLYSPNNTGRAVKLTAASTGGLGASGGLGNIVIDGSTFKTTGTARAAVELTNTDRVVLGDIALYGFNARYTSSGDTNTTDGGGGGVTDHGALTGLSDDDHTQYLLRSILTTRGDLYRRGAAAIERVALGTSGQVLQSDGTDAVWGAVPAAGVQAAGRWEVIVAGTAPPVAVTNEAEDDWLVGWIPG